MPIKFYLENRPNKKGECMIRVSIMVKSHRFITSIGNGYTISPVKWDISKQCVKKGSVNCRGFSYADMNNRINSIASEFQNFESEVLGGRPIVKDTLRSLWQTKFCKSIPKVEKSPKFYDDTFLGVYDRFMADEGKVRNWRDVIYDKFEVTRDQLRAFRPDLKFEDVTKELLADFCMYLTDECDLLNETVLKKIVDLRQFFRWTIDQQIISSSPIMRFKPKLNTTKRPIVYLEWDELMKVCQKEFSPEQIRTERIRDCFVFQCFSGLRYSDLFNLKKTDVRENSIFITTIKTSDSLEIQLNRHSKAILNKYKKQEFPGNKALPVYSNTMMNTELKTICREVGILTPIKKVIFQGNRREEKVFEKCDLIGTHNGRKTFISNAIEMGIAPDIVMKWTGHKHYSAMKPYIEISSKSKEQAMDLFNRKSTKN